MPYLCGMRTLTTILLAAMVLTTSCKQDKGHANDADHATEAIEHDHAHQTEISPQQILLNNGEKWQANAETTDGIKRLQSLAEGYSGQDVDASHLAEDMLVAYQEIFDKCTMKGEAHEQLHNYLLPLGEHLNELKACSTGCGDHVKHIQEYLHTYFNYFI